MIVLSCINLFSNLLVWLDKNFFCFIVFRKNGKFTANLYLFWFILLEERLESDTSLLIWGSFIKLGWDKRTNVVVFIVEGDFQTSRCWLIEEREALIGWGADRANWLIQ